MTIKLPGVVTAADAYTEVRKLTVAAQVLTAATAAVLTGSQLTIPDSGLKVGSRYKVKLALDKTGAGTATSTYAIGVLGSGVAVTAAALAAAGAILLTFTKPVGTAVADAGDIEITLDFLTIGAAVAEAGSIAGTFKMTHGLAATGHATVPVVYIATQDATTATILAGLGGGTIAVVATTGAGDVSSVLGCEAVLTSPPAA